MIIREPTVGPIIGWTTVSSARLWARGEQRCDTRTFGAARIRKSGDMRYGEAKVFKMMPSFDFTAIVDFADLEVNQSYDYQIGYFFADGEPGDIEITESDNWHEAARGTFKTVASKSAGETSFVFGSCRYLLRLFGGTLFDGRGDKTFRSIDRQIEAGHAIDLLLMVGDQIYADDLNVFGPDRSLDEFFSRYRKVFGQPHIRKLMGRVPTYMTLDDHEISNDWSQDQVKKNADLFAAAIHAYQCYQFVHGPGFRYSGRPDYSDTPQKLWYEFRHGNSAFFVMDTRTERHPSFSPPEMIGETQMDALLDWLTAPAHKPANKFVVTSVPFFPDTRSGSSDKWSGFKRQRLQILDHIRKNKIAKVVFLAGDVHCSMAGQLTYKGDRSFRVTSVISSSFYWPYPQGQASGFQRSGHLDVGEDQNYKLSGFEEVHSDDNFARLTTVGGKLKAEFFERKGAALGTHTLTL